MLYNGYILTKESNMKTVEGTVVTTVTTYVTVEVAVDATDEEIKQAMTDATFDNSSSELDTEVFIDGPETSYTPAALGEIEDDYNEDLYPADNRGYARRVRQLEEAGMTTSDAQGVADAEWDATGGYRFGHRTGA
jgi:hypothetical protein